MVGVGFRLEAGLRLDPFFFLGLRWKAIRPLSPSARWAVGEGMLFQASFMVGCRDAMLIAWGEGSPGMLAHEGATMSRERGAMEVSGATGPEILGF